MGNGKIRKMIKLLPLFFISSLLLFCAGDIIQPLSPRGISFPDNAYMVKVIYCPEADLCLVDIVGGKSILDERVVLGVGDYQVPSISGGMCDLEKLKGYRAASFLEELFESSKIALVLNPHKLGVDPILRGDVLIDGRNVTGLMLEMHVAVPNEAEVDWCETIGRRIEI